MEPSALKLMISLYSGRLPETSVNEASRFAGCPVVPPVGLWLILRKVVCAPYPHVTIASFEVTTELLTVAEAVIVSCPGSRAV